ncbi:DNA-directed RNA polymerase subunit D [Candidatus Bathyarchaeota archaeon]|nr:DNA-directed RNA polymerase subunit D [Candidatus Bathyarchaeota archaeon]
MEIEVLKRDDKAIQLLIHGVDAPFMNALRRTMIAEVPSMAIDEVVMIENSSVLQDEFIAHRLGFTPLKTDLDSYNLPEKCTCGSEFGCNLCRVSLVLDAEAKDGTRTVYSGELTPENPDIAPVSSRIPIVKLAKEQRLRLEAYARLGKGKNHAKWQPVSMCGYKYVPQITIDKEQCNMCGKCVDICPKAVFSKAGDKIEIRNYLACTLCQDCVDICPQNPPAIEVVWKEDDFILTFESTGVLRPERIIKESLDILSGKFKEFSDRVKVEKSDET